MAEEPTASHRYADLVGRYRAQLWPRWLEVHEFNLFSVQRRRVLLDEVKLVTLHDVRPKALSFFLWILAVFASFAALIAWAEDAPDLAQAFLFGAGAFVFLGFLALLRSARCLTVYSPRSRVAISFGSSRQAQEFYALLARQVASAQSR